MSNDVHEPVGTIDRANLDLIDSDAFLVDTGDDEIYVIRPGSGDDGEQ